MRFGTKSTAQGQTDAKNPGPGRHPLPQFGRGKEFIEVPFGQSR
jgi:hypothetical protein